MKREIVRQTISSESREREINGGIEIELTFHTADWIQPGAPANYMSTVRKSQ